ncbi:putative Pex19 [Monocercomonoides exilis]|uniref:putative Pex19 n=1 Tax=Monocercomonoides exilis TaxID=2049356 RepID=UPI003559DA9E|nr:putative Pex19 [Monocercomonoides exilis]|eukprot:MONOS_13481.1-p1 / transcript=MONOS_13481.1 / gene=MONOS_13481 / organism=Monocercomonoides_exilis_PA203 / gene_product=Pex19 / transcript_product=Pex19 / location=Mono_scaffold00835:11537-12798(-) / protein_length=258 / sequence_SO=supercontig / SO=protein_coding / is_pseudo=false
MDEFQKGMLESVKFLIDAPSETLHEQQSKMARFMNTFSLKEIEHQTDEIMTAFLQSNLDQIAETQDEMYSKIKQDSASSVVLPSISHELLQFSKNESEKSFIQKMNESYPQWLESSLQFVSQLDKKNCEGQMNVLKDILEILADGTDERKQYSNLVNKLNELKPFGYPPADLLNHILSPNEIEIEHSMMRGVLANKKFDNVIHLSNGVDSDGTESYAPQDNSTDFSMMNEKRDKGVAEIQSDAIHSEHEECDCSSDTT